MGRHPTSAPSLLFGVQRLVFMGVVFVSIDTLWLVSPQEAETPQKEHLETQRHATHNETDHDSWHSPR